MGRVVLLLALAASLCLAAKDWQQGKLVDLSVSQGTLPNGKPSAVKVFTFSVDAGDKIYAGQETSKSAPHVEVNAPIDYMLSGKDLYVKDSGGKALKLLLVKTTRK